MGAESYQFTVYTMLIGMFIVFLAMILFSVIMVVLKAAARGREGGAGDPSSGPGRPVGRPDGVARSEAGSLPGWALVAVAAYLTAEAEGREGPSAACWRPEVNQYDPWLAGRRPSGRQAQGAGVRA